MISPESPTYKWWIALALVMGTMTVSFSWSMSSVATPAMMNDFHIDIDTVQWMMTAASITMMVTMPLVGWLGGIFSKRTLYLFSLFSFIVSHLLSGFAWSFSSLVVFRIFQFVGSGVRQPLSMAMIYEAFPENQRGMAMGIYMASFYLGPLLAPIIGGILVEDFGWRAVFLINVPFGIVTFILASLILPKEERVEKREVSLDMVGLVSLTIWVTAFIAALNQGQSYGWDSAYILTLFTLAVITFIVFMIQELTTPEPLVDFALFRKKDYTLATSARFISETGSMSVNFIWNIFIQRILNYTPIQAGKLMVPGAIASVISGILSGHLSDLFDPRYVIILGITSVSLVFYKLSFLAIGISTGYIMLLMTLKNFSDSLMMAPLSRASLSSLKGSEVMMGSGLSSLLMNLGGTISIAACSTFIPTRTRQYVAIYSMGQSQANGAAEAVQALSRIYERAGDPPQIARVKSFTNLRSLITQEATLSAYQDVYRICAFLSLLVILPVLWLGKKQPVPTKTAEGRQRSRRVASAQVSS
ncbi:MAG: DHA2 family efflux MFS transporter permease subunit [Candidatus Tectomicrobia bacterium]|nr:DHA2 family efflux MFS transporter permease subunit [Candidatus Tectomicrobia bacterium]